MSSLEISLLGPPRILIDGVEFDPDRRKATALLAYLFVERGPFPREQLSGFLWPDYDRESSLAYLRRTLYEINAVFGKGWLLTDRSLVGLAPDLEAEVDVWLFEDLSSGGGSVSEMEQAATRYRGDFMAGFFLADTAPFESWQRERTESFRRSYAALLELLAERHEEQGNWERALEYASSWLSLDSLDEAAHRALMRIYAASGEVSRALRQFENCKSVFKRELGIEPHAQTRELIHRIRTGSFPQAGVLKPESDGPVRADKVRLPLFTTPFIGRQPEVEQVAGLLTGPDMRLLTLFGPGGTGKTRLSVRSAEEAASFFPDGVFFVPLETIRDPEYIVGALSAALDVAIQREEVSPRGQLIEFLQDKKMLLVLDNLEQLVGPETGSFLAEILTTAENVRIVLTSRERINIQAERLFAVTGMRFPGPAEAAAWTDPARDSLPYSAVQLFLDRASRIRQDFTLTTGNAGAVSEICSLVHGMPLGIELAAAWLELLQPEDIVLEIRRSVDFLSTDQPDVPERQRSLRAVFDYSWELLDDHERSAFTRLTVFTGSFSNAAARFVTGGTLRTLLSLTNKSWLQQAEDGRFQLHPLLHHYGWERLLEDQAVLDSTHQRHAAYFADFMAEASLRLRGDAQLETVRAISEEFTTNLKAAWDWFVEREDWETINRKMAGGLFQFAEMTWRGDQLAGWFRTARIRAESGNQRAERLAYAILGTIESYFEMNWNMLEYRPKDRIRELWDMAEVEALSGEMGIWYILLGQTYLQDNPSAQAEEKLARALERLRSANDRWDFYQAFLIRWSHKWGLATAMPEKADVLNEETLKQKILPFFRHSGALYEQILVLNFLIEDAIAKKQPQESILRLAEEIWSLCLKLGDRVGYATTYWVVGNYYFNNGNAEEGFRMYGRALEEIRNTGRPNLINFLYNWISQWAARPGTFEHALETRLLTNGLRQGLSREADRGWDHFELGEIYRIFGHVEQAKEMYALARVDFELLGLVNGLGYLERANGDLAMQNGRYRTAVDHYQAYLTFSTRDNHNWSIVHSHGRCAWGYACLGDTAEARRHIRASLTGLEQGSEDILILAALLAEAQCLAVENKYEDAAALAGYIAHHPALWNEYRTHVDRLLADIEKQMPSEDFETAKRALSGRDAETISAEWLEHMSSEKG